MKRYRRDETACYYDSFADVMYLTFDDRADVAERETPRGFFVLYTPTPERVAGVAIMDYRQRFGEMVAEIEVDATPPFVVEVAERCIAAQP